MRNILKAPSALAAVAFIAACRTSTPATMAEVSTSPTGTLSAQGADAVLWQNTSAEAQWLYEQGYSFATRKLIDNLQGIEMEERASDSVTWDRRPFAVIVDIDETVLDNSPYQVTAVKRGNTFQKAAWSEWTGKAQAKACPGSLEFLRDAQDMKCEIFYITNRDGSEKAATLRNLDSLGFPFADEDHLMLMEGTSDKTARRARVGVSHRIVLLVGDQLRDFDESFKDRSVNYGKEFTDAMADSLSQYFILLPNPMYGTYRDAIQGKGTDGEKLARMKAWFEAHGY